MNTEIYIWCHHHCLLKYTFFSFWYMFHKEWVSHEKLTVLSLLLFLSLSYCWLKEDDFISLFVFVVFVFQLMGDSYFIITVVTKMHFFPFFSCSFGKYSVWGMWKNLKNLNQFIIKNKSPNHFLLKF